MRTEFLVGCRPTLCRQATALVPRTVNHCRLRDAAGQRGSGQEERNPVRHRRRPHVSGICNRRNLHGSQAGKSSMSSGFICVIRWLVMPVRSLSVQ